MADATLGFLEPRLYNAHSMNALRIRPILPRRVQLCPGCENPKLHLNEDVKEQVVVCAQCKSSFLYDSEFGLLPYTGRAVRNRWNRFFKYSLAAWVLSWLFDFTRQSSIIDFWPKVGLYLMLGVFWHTIWVASLRPVFIEFVPREIREDRPSLNMQLLMLYGAGVFFWLFTVTTLFFGVDSLF